MNGPGGSTATVEQARELADVVNWSRASFLFTHIDTGDEMVFSTSIHRQQVSSSTEIPPAMAETTLRRYASAVDLLP